MTHAFALGEVASLPVLTSPGHTMGRKFFKFLVIFIVSIAQVDDHISFFAIVAQSLLDKWNDRT